MYHTKREIPTDSLLFLTVLTVFTQAVGAVGV